MRREVESVITAYIESRQAKLWLDKHRHRRPLFVCVLGFTETALIPGISAAGLTPADRRLTALADAEFLYNGVPNLPATYPLPPLTGGASPTFIARAIVESLGLAICLLNAGLPLPPSVPTHDLDGTIARCVSTGKAMDRSVVERLFQAGMAWGSKLAKQDGYLVMGECVVGGTTTALALLTGLGIEGQVNSSHRDCNHAQKRGIVEQGLAMVDSTPIDLATIFDLVAAIGDPMQIVVAGMILTASQRGGVLLAGGTQMLAVVALAQAIARVESKISWQPTQVIVGTTRWVVEQGSATIALAQSINAMYGNEIPLIATQLDFAQSEWPQLRAYEAGFVKEGVGAGGLAIAASLYADWGQTDLLAAIESLLARYSAWHDALGDDAAGK
jgi:uncharacterized protein (TIGR00303 family)